ncbi:helix-turn-helix domain-containing protein [Methylobacterium sp. NFXW15]|uniref:helix-turn-helix domain-containing protein n=1 Tax=Methylobacterium sp. NFXW15 TaxID=2819512 RepID=UPI003CF3F53E
MAQTPHESIATTGVGHRVGRQAGPLDAAIGARIEALRKGRKMSAGTLGNQLGLSGAQVRNYEKGTDRVPAATLFAISAIFGLPVSHLFPRGKGPAVPAYIDDITARLCAIDDLRFLAPLLDMLATIARYKSQTEAGGPRAPIWDSAEAADDPLHAPMSAGR